MQISSYCPNRIKRSNRTNEDAIKAIGQYQIDNDLTVTVNVEFDHDGYDSRYEECYGTVVKCRPDGEAWIDYVPLCETRNGYQVHYYSGRAKPNAYWINEQWTGQERKEYASELGMSKNNAYLATKESMTESANLFCDLDFWSAELVITDDLTGEEIFHDYLSHIDDYDYAEVALLVDGEDILSIMQNHVAEREEIELTTYAYA